MHNTLLDHSVISSDLEDSVINKIQNNPLGLELFKIDYNLDSLFSFLNCGNKTGEFLDKCACGIKLKPIVHHCSLRTCYPCSVIRQKRIKKQILPYLNKHLELYGYKMRYLTISPENYETEEQGLIEVRKAWNRFTETNYAKKNIKGGLYVIEVVENWIGKKIKDKYGNIIRISDKKDYHVHIHLIVYSKWLHNLHIEGEDSELKQNLDKAFRRSVFPDIKYISEDSYRFKHNLDILDYLLSYISSYSNDFENLESFAKHVKLIRRKRLIVTFGDFYNNPPPKLVINCICPICNTKKERIFSPQQIENFKKFEAQKDLNKPPNLENNG